MALGPDLLELEERAVVFTLAVGLKFIWEARVAKKIIQVHKMRAEMEAKICILRKSRYAEVVGVLESMLGTS